VTIFDFDRPACALFIVDPAAEFTVKIRHFAQRFGLTPAETRLLAEIIGGNGVFTAAAKLNITKATARTHAQRKDGNTPSAGTDPPLLRVRFAKSPKRTLTWEIYNRRDGTRIIRSNDARAKMAC
jgi:hypothetical protein